MCSREGTPVYRPPTRPPRPRCGGPGCAVTDTYLPSFWKRGGVNGVAVVTEPPAAAASLAPCRPAQPALSPPQRSAVGPVTWSEAGTQHQGPEASAASAISSPAKGQRRKLRHRFGKEGRGQRAHVRPAAVCPVRTRRSVCRLGTRQRWGTRRAIPRPCSPGPCSCSSWAGRSALAAAGQPRRRAPCLQGQRGTSEGSAHTAAAPSRPPTAGRQRCPRPAQRLQEKLPRSSSCSSLSAAFSSFLCRTLSSRRFWNLGKKARCCSDS